MGRCAPCFSSRANGSNAKPLCSEGGHGDSGMVSTGCVCRWSWGMLLLVALYRWAHEITYLARSPPTCATCGRQALRRQRKETSLANPCIPRRVTAFCVQVPSHASMLRATFGERGEETAFATAAHSSGTRAFSQMLTFPQHLIFFGRSPSHVQPQRAQPREMSTTSR